MIKPSTPKYVVSHYKKNKYYHYFRHKCFDNKLLKLPDDHTSAAFYAQYEQYLRSVDAEREANKPAPIGSIKAIANAYKTSPEYNKLGIDAKRAYDRYLVKIVDHMGLLPISSITRPVVLKLRDTFAEQARTADYYVQTLSILLTFAMDRGFRVDNPAIGVKKLSKGEGSRPFELIDLMMVKRHARHELGWFFAFALFTGMRQGDLRLLTWTQIKSGGTIQVMTSKRGKPVDVPIHPLLAKIIKTIPKRSTQVLTNTKGKPWTADGLQTGMFKLFKKSGIKERVPGKISLHGMQKTAIGILMDVGCTEAEIVAITGKSAQMVARYSRDHQRKKLSRSAGKKFALSSVKSLGKRP